MEGRQWIWVSNICVLKMCPLEGIDLLIFTICYSLCTTSSYHVYLYLSVSVEFSIIVPHHTWMGCTKSFSGYQSQHKKIKKKGVTSVAHWIKNLTTVVWNTVEVRVQFPSPAQRVKGSSVAKETAWIWSMALECSCAVGVAIKKIKIKKKNWKGKVAVLDIFQWRS